MTIYELEKKATPGPLDNAYGLLISSADSSTRSWKRPVDNDRTMVAQVSWSECAEQFDRIANAPDLTSAKVEAMTFHDHGPDYLTAKANAALLVHCRNHFMDALAMIHTLKAALKNGEEWTDEGGTYDKARLLAIKLETVEGV